MNLFDQFTSQASSQEFSPAGPESFWSRARELGFAASLAEHIPEIVSAATDMPEGLYSHAQLETPVRSETTAQVIDIADYQQKRADQHVAELNAQAQAQALPTRKAQGTIDEAA